MLPLIPKIALCGILVMFLCFISTPLNGVLELLVLLKWHRCNLLGGPGYSILQMNMLLWFQPTMKQEVLRTLKMLLIKGLAEHLIEIP